MGIKVGGITFGPKADSFEQALEHARKDTERFEDEYQNVSDKINETRDKMRNRKRRLLGSR